MASSTDQKNTTGYTDKEPLQYRISEQNAILVVSFSGALIISNLHVLERCKTEIIESTSSFVVLHFQRVAKLDAQSAPALIQLQDLIRDKPAILRLCFLTPQFKKTLSEHGALHRGELAGTLVEAVQGFGFRL